MKVYHGIPKSIIDEHTIFYADFDGSGIPVVGSIDKPGNISGYKHSPIGYHPTSGGNIICTTTKATDVFTIDMFVPKFPKVTNGNKGIMTLKSSAGNDLVHIQIPSQQDYLALVTITNGGWQRLTNSQQDCFVRLVVNKGKITTYINGKKFVDYPKIDMPNFNEIRMELHPSLWQGVCDLHISDIDRGDYFPNLPQDFIEGKAIIKPRMGQQQVKGDPMQSQSTQLTVHAHAAGDWSLYNPVPANGAHSSYNNPELSVAGGTNWAQGSFVRITGLNGEVISGVVDADTAVAFITENSSGTTRTIKVSDVSKLSVGDTFKIGFIKGGTWFSTDKTIESIDVANKTITWTIHSTVETVSTLMCIYETTASSSCPTVKTKGGTDVVGTWSGLGTNVATFTLGNNTTNLQGQDLYVEYALTMPHGNSDFPELPHTIEKAWEENGIEMKPVNEIVITDDLKGKIANSDKECPHKLYYSGTSNPTTCLLPKQFKLPAIQIYYDRLDDLDGTTESVACTNAGGIPQQLFSFNLIEVVERKLGCEIPDANKAQWLRNNIITFACTAYGTGAGPSGPKYIINNYYPGDNRWFNDFKTHTSATISPVTYEQSEGWISRSIDDNGFVYFLVYTEASSASVQSAISTDYVRLKVKLKTHATFTTLYCENTGAREDKCNPILIQKETKTVKRYLPSKAPFVTECKYIKANKQKINHDILNNAVDNGRSYATTQGTGNYAVYGQSWRYKNIINLLNLELIQPYEYNNEGLYTNPFTSKVHTTFISEYSDGYIGNNLRFMPCQAYDVPKYLVFKPYIVAVNGELKLSIASSEVTRSVAGSSYASQLSKSEFAAFELPNRPLIK